MIQYKHSKTAGKLSKKLKLSVGRTTTKRKVFHQSCWKEYSWNGAPSSAVCADNLMEGQLQYMLFASVMTCCRCCLCQQSGLGYSSRTLVGTPWSQLMYSVLILSCVIKLTIAANFSFTAEDTAFHYGWSCTFSVANEPKTLYLDWLLSILCSLKRNLLPIKDQQYYFLLNTDIFHHV